MRLQAVAEMLEKMDLEKSVLPGELSDQDLARIEQSKEDVRQGLPRVQIHRPYASLLPMTRMQTIEQITAKLATLDDDRLQVVAEMLEDMDLEESVLPRELTDEELALIEQSREDFRQGRTLSAAEAWASIDEALARAGAIRAKA